MQPIKEFDLYFSCAQFSFFDKALAEPFLEWDEQHTAQGFVRGDSIAAVGTLLGNGIARATVFAEPPRDVAKYQRVIVAPMAVTSGRVAFSNPDALPEEAVEIHLPSGHYRVFIAQKLNDDRKSESVDIFFEKTAVSGEDQPDPCRGP
jgi:hypothetical protein